MGPHPKKPTVRTFTPKPSRHAEQVKAKAAAGTPMPVDKAMPQASAPATAPPGVKPPGVVDISPQERARRKMRSETLAWLKGAYPALMRPAGPPLPLPIGFGDMAFARALEAGHEPWAVRSALRFHCNGIAYLEALAAAGAMRCDLNGVPIEPVTPKHQAFAKVRLEEIAARLSDKSGSHRSPLKDGNRPISSGAAQSRG